MNRRNATSTGRLLSRTEARTFYDRFGSRQDRQGWYENAALDAVVALGAFGTSRSVFELGCGTGRFAARLLAAELPPEARYDALELSPVMARLAEDRLRAFAPRAQVRRYDGGTPLPGTDAFYDRFLATYVLDLLSEPEIALVLGEARRLLRPGGLLCLAGLTHGVTPLSRLASGLWRLVHRTNPAWVGGCRPLRVAPLLASSLWRLRHNRTVVARGIASEVLIAERL